MPQLAEFGMTIANNLLSKIISFCHITTIFCRLLSRQLIRRCCNLYNELYKYVNRFQYIGLPWLPKNQQLPYNLEQCLSVQWMHSGERKYIYDKSNF